MVSGEPSQNLQLASVPFFIKYNQWTCTKDALDWFSKIKNKNCASFIQFDIIDFYPSITENTLDKAIQFAATLTEITMLDIKIIKHCRRSVLKSGGHTWIKNNCNQHSFDGPMGAYALVADLIGLYILHILNRCLNNDDVGIYRDDGLMVVRDSNGPKCNKIAKKITRAMKEKGFRVDIKSNIKIVDFLDVTLNLNEGSYKPFMK